MKSDNQFITSSFGASNVQSLTKLKASEEQRARAAFEKLDIQCTGYLSVDQLPKIHDMGRSELLALLDVNRDGRISVDEWIMHMQSRKTEKGKKKF